MKGASTDEQLKGEQTAIHEVIGATPAEQPPAPSLDASQTPEARGIVGKDFAGDNGSASSQQLTAGELTFNMPNFEDSSSSKDGANGGAPSDDILSPTES